MKNLYYSPEVDIHRLEQMQMICASDDSGFTQDYESLDIWNAGIDLL